MDIGRLVRSVALPIADRISDGAQDTVLIYPWIGYNTSGGPAYAPTPVPHKAIIEEKTSEYLKSATEVVNQKAVITIPRPIAPNGAAERTEPVDPRDQIVLPSGYTGPILDVNGPIDPKTHAPYMFTIILG